MNTVARLCQTQRGWGTHRGTCPWLLRVILEWAGVPVLFLASDRGSLCSDVSVSFPLPDKRLRKSVYEEKRLIWFTF